MKHLESFLEMLLTFIINKKIINKKDTRFSFTYF